jgi:hypothetical protein
MALLRRMYLDLIGLPPTIAKQERHSSLDAVIDDLLTRPEYGERWARHWLDVVRYADSNGYERDAEKALCLALPRLRHRSAQQGQTLRPLRHRAARGR